jgi:hypothetical protein
MTRHFIRHSDGIVRECSRCRRELTDAASREAGVGPICRRKNNTLFARQIPANINVASALFLSLRANNFHESVEGYDSIRNTFINKMCHLQVNNDDLTAVTLQGSDFRGIVDWFDYSLSFRCSYETRLTVIQIIEALGYVGLASVLRGDACMSEAVLLVQDGFITLSGKSCKAGYYAMKRSIPGVKTPRYRGDTTPYKASVRHAEKFVEIALRHWPFIENNIEEVLADAKKASADLPPCDRAEDPTVARPTAQFARLQRTWFAVKTPWFGTREEMNEMLAKFKELPRRERHYHVGTRRWEFHTSHLAAVLAIVDARYTCEWRDGSVVTAEGGSYRL